jgi:hypothetical protein
MALSPYAVYAEVISETNSSNIITTGNDEAT